MWVIALVVAAIIVASLVCLLTEVWAAQLVDEDERPIYHRGGQS